MQFIRPLLSEKLEVANVTFKERPEVETLAYSLTAVGAK